LVGVSVLTQFGDKRGIWSAKKCAPFIGKGSVLEHEEENRGATG